MLLAEEDELGSRVRRRSGEAEFLVRVKQGKEGSNPKAGSASNEAIHHPVSLQPWLRLSPASPYALTITVATYNMIGHSCIQSLDFATFHSCNSAHIKITFGIHVKIGSYCIN
ncbi:hypothetical protein Tco_1497630 [Tanacetum coccineum]